MIRRLISRAVATALICIAAVPPSLDAVEHGDAEVLTAPLEVRVRTRELAAALADPPTAAGPLAQLIDRIDSALDTSANLLVADGSGLRPVGWILADSLRNSSALAAWQARSDGPAERLRAEATNAVGLIAVAQRYPATATAEAIWTTLADRAWDRGRLAATMAFTARLTAPDSGRRRRAQLAGQLLARPLTPSLPAGLRDLSPLWLVDDLQLSLAGSHTPTGYSRHARRHAGRITYATLGERLLINDGTRALLVEPLTGETVGQPIRLGMQPPVQGPLPPATADDQAVVLGQDPRGQPRLLALDQAANVVWSSRIDIDGVQRLSRPMILDDLVAFAAFISQRDAQERVELRLIALDRRTGAVAWNRFVAQLPPQARGGASELPVPDLATHHHQFAILSNQGFVAWVTATGTTSALWPYANPGGDTGIDLLPRGGDDARVGRLIGDGGFLVAAPTDNLELMVFEQPGSPRHRYLGNGSRDTLTAVAAGSALLVGRRVTLFDYANGSSLWSLPSGAGNQDTAWGVIGERSILAASGPRLVLRDRVNGHQLAVGSLSGATDLTVVDSVLVRAQIDRDGHRAMVIGETDLRGFQRLEAAVAARPNDYRAHIALASMHRARGERDAAFQRLLQALANGAPERFAEDAAELARRDVDLALGGEDFDTAIGRLEVVARFAPSLRGELSWWRGRQAELAGRFDIAANAYRTVLTAQPAWLTLDHGTAADLHALAAAGLARLEVISRPHWMEAISLTAPKPVAAGGNWQRDGRILGRPTVLADENMLIAYTSGTMQAIDLSDGSTRWRRQPGWAAPGLLGVQYNRPDGPVIGGVEITQVLAGSAADGLGLLPGDRILEINGRRLIQANDLSDIIADVGPGDPLSVTVARAGLPPIDPNAEPPPAEILTVAGEGGGQPMAVIDHAAGRVLMRSLGPGRNGDRRGIGRVEASFAAHDLHQRPRLELYDSATGRLLWSRNLDPLPERAEREIIEPFITDDGGVVFADGPVLVRADPNNGDTWRRDAPGPGLQRIGNGLLLARRADDQGPPRASILHLIDATTGRTLFTIPGTADEPVLIGGGDLITVLPGNRLACWDLGRGRLRWTNSEGSLQPLALAGDALLVRDRDLRIQVLDRGNGTIRRRVGEWASVLDWVQIGDQLVVHARDRHRDQLIASIGLRGGAVLWSQRIPGSVEVLSGREGLRAMGNGIGVTLRDAESGSATLQLDAQGRLLSARRLVRGRAHVIDGAHGRLEVTATGLIHHAMGMPNPLEPWEPTPLEANAAQRSLAGMVASQMGEFDWQASGNSAWATAQIDGDLVLVARIAADEDGLVVRLGDTASAIDPGGQALWCRHSRIPSLNRDDIGWRLVAAVPIETDEATADGAWTIAVRLGPPLLEPGARPALRVRPARAPAESSNTPPWWLLRGWIPLRLDNGLWP